jgi:hypothetical protein
VKGWILDDWAQKSPELWIVSYCVFPKNLCHYLRMGEQREPCAQSLSHPISYQKVPPCWWGLATGPPTSRCGQAKILLSWCLVLVTLHCGLQLVLSRTIRIGGTKSYLVWLLNSRA